MREGVFPLSVNPQPFKNRPTRDETLMDVANAFEQQSTCDRNHVGSVIAINGRVVSTGYNGAPAGLPHCNHHGVNPAVPAGMTMQFGRGCITAIHAEANAIAYAAKHGVSIDAGTIYTTLSPCFACAQLIVAAGLIRVVYRRSYRDLTGVNYLHTAGIAVVQAE